MISRCPRRTSVVSNLLNLKVWRIAFLATTVFGVAIGVGYVATAAGGVYVSRILESARSSIARKSRPPVASPTNKAKLNPAAVPQVSEPTISTDKLNYSPGETAIISGSGFAANAKITLQVQHSDGGGEVGHGHEPWDVFADALGNLRSTWFVDPDDSADADFILTAKDASGKILAVHYFRDGNAAANLDQCANGGVGDPHEPCTMTNWVNGNLGASKAHYNEGDSVPYRLRFSNLDTAVSHTVTFSWDTTKSGKHAIDYVTSFDRTETLALGNNPCSGVSGCDLGVFDTEGIPVDANVTNGFNGVDDVPAGPTGGDDITQVPGVFTLFNGTITAVSGYTLSGSYAGDSTTSITLTFTASTSNPVLAWGGHIGTRVDWGILNSAINIPGSPYHTSLVDLDGSGGSQDRSLSADAVFFPISLTIIKETDPDDAQSKTFDYTTTGTDLSAFSLTPANGTTQATKNFTLTDDSARSVTESDPSAAAPEFDLTSLSCVQTDGGLGVGTFNTNLGTRTVSFTPKEGQSLTCTFINTENQNLTRGKIIVDKVTDPSSDTTSFDFTTTYGSPFSLTHAATPNDSGLIIPGTYQVTETPNSDYVTTATCTSSLAHPADNPNSIDLAAGEVVTCTFTNAKKPKLTVTKIVVNDNGGTKQISDFPLFVDGNSVSSGVKNTSTVGSHTVTETTDPGYTSTIGGHCAPDGSITLAAGDDKECTITNDDNAPSLTLVKQVVNDNGGTAQATDFTLTATGPTPISGAGGTSSGASFDAGTYTLSETNVTGYTAGDWNCVGGTQNGSDITLALGESATCTIINNDNAPSLTLVKQVVNGSDPGGTASASDFTLTAAGPTGFSGVGPSVSNGPSFDAGMYTLSETGPAGYDASPWVCVGGSQSDNKITLGLGQSATCTITNTARGEADVIKKVSGGQPAANQTFTFEIRSGASTSSDGAVVKSATTDASGNLDFDTLLIPGQTYQICEWVFPGWNTDLSGDGPLFVPNSIIPPALPNPNVNNLTVCVNFTVQPGQTRTFTVNNTPPPGGRALTIGFWKNWASCANSQGKGQKATLDFALGRATANTTNPPGGLVVSAQNPGSLWPNYAAIYYLILKGNAASTEDSILPAQGCTYAVNLLNKTTTDGKKKMASDPMFNMAAQLVAAQLNRFLGAGINGSTIMNIDRAVLLLGKYAFNGKTYNKPLTTADINTANCLAIQLDNYNNNRPVSLCP